MMICVSVPALRHNLYSLCFLRMRYKHTRLCYFFHTKRYMHRTVSVPVLPLLRPFLFDNNAFLLTHTYTALSLSDRAPWVMLLSTHPPGESNASHTG